MTRSSTALWTLLAAPGGLSPLWAPEAPPIGQASTEIVSPSYAESAALVGMTASGELEFAMRIARFPGRRRGTLWLAAYVGDRRYSVAQEDVSLGDVSGATPVEDAKAAFSVAGPAHARIECQERHTAAMTCSALAEALTHDALHPPLGAGTIPLRVEAEFQARHAGDTGRPGRMEVFGTVKATIETPDGTYRFESPGKYHEQTGDRPSFAGSFTYFAVQGDGGSLLARTGGGATWGFALLGGKTVAVRTFAIDPPGTSRRAFKVELADGRVIEGTTDVVRETSVPIEGQRRPSATVRVSSSLGDLTGHLNDWKPPA